MAHARTLGSQPCILEAAVAHVEACALALVLPCGVHQHPPITTANVDDRVVTRDAGHVRDQPQQMFVCSHDGADGTGSGVRGVVAQHAVCTLARTVMHVWGATTDRMAVEAGGSWNRILIYDEGKAIR